jgi:hypothetical protein
MSLAKWRQDLQTNETKYIWQVGVGLFGGFLALLFCLGASTERGPKPVGMFLFIVAVCLAAGYVFGKLTWGWHRWFARLNRVIDHYVATHPETGGEENGNAR